MGCVSSYEKPSPRSSRENRNNFTRQPTQKKPQNHKKQPTQVRQSGNKQSNVLSPVKKIELHIADTSMSKQEEQKEKGRDGEEKVDVMMRYIFYNGRYSINVNESDVKIPSMVSYQYETLLHLNPVSVKNN